MKLNKNLFITFEGIDGSGKDTQLFLLAKQIKEDDNYPFGNKFSNIWITREPTNITSSGIKVAELIRSGKEIDGKVATQLYIQDRIEHTKIINKVLLHSHVLCSRYDISTLTYQYVQGEDFENLYQLHNYNRENGTIIPEITLVFDIPLDIALERINKRGEKKEFFEKKEFLEKLVVAQHKIIEKLKKKGRNNIIVINANQSIEDVSKEMFEKIYNFLKHKYDKK